MSIHEGMVELVTYAHLWARMHLLHRTRSICKYRCVQRAGCIINGNHHVRTESSVTEF